MRARLAVVVLVGCGGEEHAMLVDGRPSHDAAAADMTRPIDASVDAPVDAYCPGPAPTCSVDAAFGNLSFGSSSSPIIRNNFDAAPAPYTGQQEFFLAARLGPNTPPIDAMVFSVVEPTTGFATNVAYPFQTDPLATTWSATAYVLGDFDANTNALANMYWATNGSITFTAIDKQTGGLTSGIVSTVTFQEIDQNTGAFMPCGCSTSLQALTFFLQQN